MPEVSDIVFKQARQSGRPVGRPRSVHKSSNVTVTIRLPRMVNEKLNAYALDKGMRKGQVVTAAVTELMAQSGVDSDSTPVVSVEWVKVAAAAHR